MLRKYAFTGFVHVGHPRVSRVHAYLVALQTSDDTFLFQIENLSKRGLLVNGERLAQHDFRVLRHRDRVVLHTPQEAEGPPVGFVFHDTRTSAADLLERPSHFMLLRSELDVGWGRGMR